MGAILLAPSVCHAGLPVARYPPCAHPHPAVNSLPVTPSNRAAPIKVKGGALCLSAQLAGKSRRLEGGPPPIAGLITNTMHSKNIRQAKANISRPARSTLLTLLQTTLEESLLLTAGAIWHLHDLLLDSVYANNWGVAVHTVINFGFLAVPFLQAHVRRALRRA